MGHHKEALDYFDKVIEINPRDANAWYNKGWTLYQLERYSSAKQCFIKANELGYAGAKQMLERLEKAGNEPAVEIKNIGNDEESMVLIPAGEFQMGSSGGMKEERPVHTVYLDAFYIDKYEVTNAQYRKFMHATGHKAPLGMSWNNPKLNAPDHPVVGVSWHDAVAYAKWAGKRLPTEAEWEKAARGGLVGKKYSWGDDDPDETRCNYGTFAGMEIPWNADTYTAPVGSYPPNKYGLYDMAGNVWEWCTDWYDPDYYRSSPGRNPTGPESGDVRVARGGSWDHPSDFLRAAYRNWAGPTVTLCLFGFRCALSVSGDTQDQTDKQRWEGK